MPSLPPVLGVERAERKMRPAIEWLPEHLQPSAVPLVMVCGPPAAGKTTYVAARKAAGDVVIDLDEIGVALSGEPKTTWSREWLAPAVAERNRMLAGLAVQTAGAAWFIAGEPFAEHRQWWHDALRPAAIVVLEVGVKECVRRCRADPARAPLVEHYRELVESWWARYSPRDGDTVLRS